MIANIYNTKEDTIVTDISGGREHFTYRQPVHASDTYKYETSYGENLYTLAAIIFGSDDLWWILSDFNIPLNPLAIAPSTIIELPSDVVKDDGTKKFVG